MSKKKKEGAGKELEVKNNIFFVIDTEIGKWILVDEESAIEKMKGIAKEKEIDLEKTAIWEVNTEPEEKGKKGQWENKQVPWSKIAQALLREE